MNKTILASILALSSVIGFQAFAAAAKTYQVTGPVLEVTDSSLVVDKGGEKWEISKEAATKINGGEVKVGTKVTIKYKMIATDIEVKKAK